MLRDSTGAAFLFCILGSLNALRMVLFLGSMFSHGQLGFAVVQYTSRFLGLENNENFAYDILTLASEVSRSDQS
jgi:hypothetical protein